MGCVSSKQGKYTAPSGGGCAEPSNGRKPAEHNDVAELTAEPIAMVTDGEYYDVIIYIYVTNGCFLCIHEGRWLCDVSPVRGGDRLFLQ